MCLGVCVCVCVCVCFNPFCPTLKLITFEPIKMTAILLFWAPLKTILHFLKFPSFLNQTQNPFGFGWSHFMLGLGLKWLIVYFLSYTSCAVQNFRISYVSTLNVIIMNKKAVDDMSSKSFTSTGFSDYNVLF